jgi:hypothetical protein
MKLDGKASCYDVHPAEDNQPGEVKKQSSQCTQPWSGGIPKEECKIRYDQGHDKVDHTATGKGT